MGAYRTFLGKSFISFSNSTHVITVFLLTFIPLDNLPPSALRTPSHSPSSTSNQQTMSTKDLFHLFLLQLALTFDKQPILSRFYLDIHSLLTLTCLNTSVVHFNTGLRSSDYKLFYVSCSS